MRKKQIAIIGLVVFIATSMITFSSLSKKDIIINNDDTNSRAITEEDVGKMCVAAVFPTITRGAERVELVVPPADLADRSEIVVSEIQDNITQDNVSQDNVAQIDVPQDRVPQEYVEPPVIIDTQPQNPLVIIYHTHATESFQPVSEGNFHTLDEEGSVREVGNILTEELKNLGIEVIHDKSVHDQPSYSQSYSRSMATAKSLMAKYPTAVFIVDLHRDAASYTGNVGQTVLVNGETAAKYSVVIGQGNPNVRALEAYAKAINAKAEEMYPGFGGKIINKAYKFNQYISDYYILLEVGNNENNIKEAKITAKYFAQVLAEVIKDIKQV